MLAGEAVVAIWNGIAPEGRNDFYEWHIREHMPERVGTPGFRRGRRYRALDAETRPEYFTLYEVDTFQVLQGRDYTDRLNAPTDWTRRATAHFQNTSRALARVLASFGHGPGGTLLTIRFDVSAARADEVRAKLTHKLLEIAELPQITGAHLCRADSGASVVRTEESRTRTDIEVPPTWFVLVEACTVAALDTVEASLRVSLPADGMIQGCYFCEYTRLKTSASAG
jgi:hypothetical protein